MPAESRTTEVPVRGRRADAQYNEEALLATAAAVFVNLRVGSDLGQDGGDDGGEDGGGYDGGVRHDPRRLVELLLQGLWRPSSS